MKRIPPRLLTCLSALALVLGACQKPSEVPVPQRLIPREQMVGLLVELHLLETRTDGSGLPPDSTRALFQQEQKKLYQRYQVADSAFVQSYRYYAIHAKDLDAIYAAVIDSLALREARQQPPGTQSQPPRRGRR